MKKFLSLLLALTLVLSLVVVPARAADGDKIAGLTISSTGFTSGAVTKGQDVTFAINATSAKIQNSSNQDIANATIQPVSYSYRWNLGSSFDLKSPSNTSQQVMATASAVSTTAKVTCTVTCSYTVEGDETVKTATATVETDSLTVNDAITRNEITGIQFNGRNYGNTAVYYVGNTEKAALTSAEGATDSKWVISSKTNLELVSTSFNEGENKVTLNVKRGSAPNVVNGSITVTATEATSRSGNITVSSPASPYRVGMELTLNVPESTNKNSPLVSYRWSAKDKDNKPVSVSVSADNKWTPAVAGEYTLTRDVYENSVKVGSNVSDKITIAKDGFAFVPKAHNPSMSPNGTQTLSFEFYSLKENGSKNKDIDLSDVKWTVTGTGMNAKNLAVTQDNKSAILTIPASGTGSTCAVSVSFVYENKTYSHTYNINLKTTTALLPSIQNNTAVTLYSTNNYGSSYNLAAIAKNALVADKLIASTDTVASVVIELLSCSNCSIRLTSNSPVAYTMTSPSIGTATFKAKATVTGKGEFPITFSATVTPIATTYEAQYPEPVASYGNTYKYYVQVPAGASYYYVVGTPNQSTTPTDFTQGGKTVYYTTSTNLYPLTDSNFVNGQCTLWIVTKNSSDNRLYYGQLTVYQKNYNINYNGVAGETVQFAQSDFTDFMNEVAEARGDASKTKSYPYVTFDYVTFSLPTTAQGTLYYGGTAMSTSNSSGAFNTRTKVTNLDSVTFVPNAKSTAKTITLNFTLYATRYSSSSTSRGTTVSYSGSVVVNLVREDIKYTVSQGDSVRFDESDFLSYLRSTKGYSSNYTIDYVTFDQSAVSAVNEGSLYTYYNGYNYGGSIKTTDKFYYSATASQNALSDVAFLASRYAKTGETVYIPFTIYARYGTTGTGTRQLTGTVAIKIGQTMNFIDVKTTDYFYDSVKWAVNKGVTTGTSSTTFSPYNPCKRAEIVTFLWRAAGSPEPTTTRNPFRDVNAVTHSSYYKAILWASQKGIAAGTSTTTFSPDQVCTRAQIVTFLYRYAGKPSGYYSNPFKDVSATNEASYYNAILWASGKGITTGSSPTTFSPYASCNRAEAVTFLYRYTNGL